MILTTEVLNCFIKSLTHSDNQKRRQRSIELFTHRFSHGSCLIGGMGTTGCVQTTIVVVKYLNYGVYMNDVYCGGEYIYTVPDGPKFREDLKNHELKTLSQITEYGSYEDIP